MHRKKVKEEIRDVLLKQERNPGPVTVTVRVTYIRDGTPGISLTIGEKIVGEWTDSRAESLVLTQDYRISIYGIRNRLLYNLVMPGTLLGGEQISDKEVAVTLQI
jgi:hypothetical protein